jgi:GTP cyclohydrolase I
VNHGKIEQGVRLILQGLECDAHDPNFAETPERVARAYEEMFAVDEDNEYTTFTEAYADFILLRRHKVWSLCPHHLLPVRLIVSVAYIPAGKVLGLSKLARVLNDCNPGPVLQEAFTREVVSRLESIVSCSGVACFVEGSHGCMQIRGVKTDGDVVTSAFSGSFLANARLQDRFFQLIGSYR